LATMRRRHSCARVHASVQALAQAWARARAPV
jgi:hypothetical protein